MVLAGFSGGQDGAKLGSDRNDGIVWNQNFSNDAVSRRLHFKGGLLRFYIDENLAAGDDIAFLDPPRHNAAFLHGHSQGGHRDVSSHNC
jgi:hypothetical protein